MTTHQLLDPKQSLALKNVIAGGFAHACERLQKLTGTRVALHVPTVRWVDVESVPFLNSEPESNHVVVGVRYDGTYGGRAYLIFGEGGASLLSSNLSARSGLPAPGPEQIDVLREVGNIILTGIVQRIDELTKCHHEFAVPTFHWGPVRDLMTIAAEGILLIDSHLEIKNLNLEVIAALTIEPRYLGVFLNSVAGAAA